MGPLFQFLQKFLENERRYVEDLRAIVEVYYHQLKMAVDSNHVAIRRDHLDTIFMNWSVSQSVSQSVSLSVCLRLPFSMLFFQSVI